LAQSVKQDVGEEGSPCGPDPPAAVDRKRNATADSRRDQLVDGPVDRRVLAADAGPGQQAETDEAPVVPCQAGSDGEDEIDRERDREQVLPSEAVGEVAEDERARDRTDEVEGACQAACRVVRPSASLWVSMLAIAPTRVTSKPS